MPYLTRLPLGLHGLRRTPIGNRLGVMNRLFGARLASKGVSWVETAPGVPWKVDLSNPCHRWMVYGDYADPGFLAWARDHVPRDGVIVDSGTNIGQFLPYFGKIAQEGRILAFEPSPYCARWVRECLRVNSELGVELVNAALGETEDIAFLQREDEAHGLWGEVVNDGDSGTEIEVSILSKELEKREVRNVDLWKLDVEGYELQALRGAEKHLENGLVRGLYVELTAENRNEGVRYLN